MPVPRDTMYLLDHWAEHGLAVHDAGDGAWAWTVKGRRINAYVRMRLSDLLYHRGPLDRWEHAKFAEEGFAPDGFLIEEGARSCTE